jgi:hypothetical protein
MIQSSNPARLLTELRWCIDLLFFIPAITGSQLLR